ncbi:MAG: radical SAM protein [Candidatus Woesearchaeota archaeon]
MITYLHFGHECNNNCLFCHSKRDYIVQVHSPDTKHVLSGSECLQRQNIFKLVSRLSSKGEVIVNTNGRMLSYAKFAKKLVNSGARQYKISLHGHDAKTHDFITRVNGSFKQTVLGIKNLQKLGADIIISVVITRLNYLSMDAILRLLKELRVTNAQFILVKSDDMNIGVSLAPNPLAAASSLEKSLLGCKWFDYKIKDFPPCLLLYTRSNIVFHRHPVDKVKNIACTACSLSNKCDGVWAKYVHFVSPQKAVPEEVKIEVTRNCNLSCAFCYNNNTVSEIPEMPLEKALFVIDKLAKEGVTTIRFTGGEPLVHKGLFKMFRQARRRRLRIKLNTNALLITPSLANTLACFVDESLVSLNPVNGKITSKTFAKKLANIRELRRRGVRVVLDTVPVGLALKNIKTFYNIAKSLDSEWFCERPIPKGSQSFITKKQMMHLINVLIELNKKDSKVKIPAIPFCVFGKKEKTKVSAVSAGAGRCGGFTSLTIDPTGNIRLCYSDQRILGNIFKDLISEVWSSQDVVSVRALDNLNRKCRDCNYVNECLGGCRVAAKESFTGRDPLAVISK